MKSLCGIECEDCEMFKDNKCYGCKNTDGCPFGKKCWIAKYVEIGGEDNFEELKSQLIKEFNSLNIDGMSKVENLYALNGNFINLEYVLPNNKKVKFLDDDEIYLGNQLKCEFNDNEIKKCYGLVANINFILVCEYEESGNNPEIIIYKRR